MTAAQFLQFVERKLMQAGVHKVAPEGEVLVKAYRRAWRQQSIQDAVDEAMARTGDDAIIPANLAVRLRRKVNRSQMAWDEALHEIVKQQRGRPTGS